MCVCFRGARSFNWQFNPTGILTGLISGAFFRYIQPDGKSSANRGINSWTALFYSFFDRGRFPLPLFSNSPDLFGRSRQAISVWLGDAWLGWLLLLALAIGPTLGGYGLYTFRHELSSGHVAPT